MVTAWRDALSKAGKQTELGTNLIIGFSTYIADTQEQAIKEAKPFFEENMKLFAPLGFVPGLTTEQIEGLSNPATASTTKLPTLEDSIEAGAWLCGPPELIIEKLTEIQERYPGLTEVNIGQPVGTPQSVILEQLERFAEEVMPEFQYPVDIIYRTEDSDSTVTINNEEEMLAAKNACREEWNENEYDEDCFELVLPVTYIMPDGSTITVASEEGYIELRDWYEENGSEDEDQEPSLQYPVDIIYETEEGELTVTINSDAEMESAYAECYGDDEGS